MRIIRLALVASILPCWFVSSALAQGMFGARRDPGAGLAEIFGKDKSFSAVAHTAVKDPSGNEMQMETSYAVLEGKIRSEMDMAKMQGGRIPPQALAQMLAMGMDKTVTIMLPEKHTGYLVYPGLKAYCELPTPTGSSATESNKPPKVERTEVGRETIDGHPCVKYKVVVTPENGPSVNALVWQATDLKDYPIQTQVDAGGSTITTLFQNINQHKPAASLFEPPSDYKRYGSMQELMMSAMGGMPGGMPRGRSSMPPMPPGEKQ